MKVYFLSFFRDVIKIKSTCVDVTSILNKRVRSLPGVILNKRKYNNDKVDITISFEKSGIFIDFLDVKYVYENINIYNTDNYPIIYSVLYKLFLIRELFGIDREHIIVS